MDLLPSQPVRPPESVEWRAGGQAHAGVLDGATLTGEAARRQASIRIGLWLDESGWVRRARWRSAGDPALCAYAETACALVESGVDPLAVDSAALRNALAGAGSAHDDYADLVASALHAAMLLGGQRNGA
jgi:hypothetical protein